MPDSTDNSHQTPHSGFDYCFWSKLLVAIVLFPLVAFIAAYFFVSPVAKILAAAFAIGGIVRAAIWIDGLPCLAGKIPALIGKK
jgi:hypothetical protein